MRERRKVHPQQLGGPFADKIMYGRHCWVHGVAVKESTGAATASFQLHDGNDTTGPNVLPYNLAANESARDWFGDGGIFFEGGLFLNVLSGSCSGTVFVSDERGGSDVEIHAHDIFEE